MNAKVAALILVDHSRFLGMDLTDRAATIARRAGIECMYFAASAARIAHYATRHDTLVVLDARTIIEPKGVREAVATRRQRRSRSDGRRGDPGALQPSHQHATSTFPRSSARICRTPAAAAARDSLRDRCGGSPFRSAACCCAITCKRQSRHARRIRVRDRRRHRVRHRRLLGGRHRRVPVFLQHHPRLQRR